MFALQEREENKFKCPTVILFCLSVTAFLPLGPNNLYKAGGTWLVAHYVTYTNAGI